MPEEERRPSAPRWHMVEPVGFDASWQRYLPSDANPTPSPALAYPVSWSTLRQIQSWDEETHAGKLKQMHWLTPRHFQLGGFDRMSVGLALDILKRETARMLRWLRERKWPRRP